MNVLILNSNNGGGHNSAAKALQEAAEQRGDACRIEDCMAYLSPRLSRFAAWLHSFVYRHAPKAFSIAYRYTEKHSAMFQRGRPVRRVIGIGKKRLAQAVRDGGYDLVLCCHVFAGMMLADAVEKYALPCKTALIETDYTASPGSEFCGDLLHFVPTESVKEALIRRGVLAGKITVSGIPVRQSFYGEISRQEAKARLGISGEQMHLLIMCGSMGCGPIESVLEELKEPAKGPPTVSVVCGNNSRLYRRLSERYRANDSIRVYGQCEDIPLLMDSAELYLTKPGGLSVTEAAAKGLPMVLVDLVAGCEAHNLSLFTSSRGAVSGETASELARLCLSLLADPDKRERMSGSLKRLVQIRSAEAVLAEMSALPIPARLPTNAEYCTGGSDCHAGIGADSADRRLLLFWPAYFLSFFLLELSSKGRDLHLVHCALDDRIPFCEWFIIPYCLWHVLIAVMVIYTLLREAKTFRQLMRYFISSYCITLMVYMLWPTCQELRPAVFPRENALTWAVSLIYRFDTPTNVCPSLHIVGALGLWFASRELPRFSAPGWKAAWSVTVLLICLSTVFLKQHSLVDVAAALPVSFLCRRFSFRFRSGEASGRRTKTTGTRLKRKEMT